MPLLKHKLIFEKRKSFVSFALLILSVFVLINSKVLTKVEFWGVFLGMIYVIHNPGQLTREHKPQGTVARTE